MTNALGSLSGARIEQLPTPALVVDLDALERNLSVMALWAARSNIRLRPHAKAHKCVEIARRQMALGAVGICCQTVAEVEAFASAGITDILLTNQIADRQSAIRLDAIGSDVRVGLCVDDHVQVELLAATLHRDLDIYVEVEVGGGRCGVRQPEEALDLARAATESGFRFAGLQAYNGKIQHVRNAVERFEAVRSSGEATRAFVDAFERASVSVGVITGGGTGTVEFDLEAGILSEVQCGTYALMDADYRSLESSRPNPPFECALAILARIVSRSGEQAIVNAGLKALAFDSGMPVSTDPEPLVYSNPSDEHGVVRFASGVPAPPLGRPLRFIPGHCDPTVALHELLFVVRDWQVEDAWQTVARGTW